MNKLYKSLIFDKQVSLSVLETTELVNAAIKTHNLSGAAAVTLGNMLTAAAYMAGCLKSDRGAVSLTVKAEGDAGTVSVSGDKDLHIRGYIDVEKEGRLKGGYLTVIKDDGFSRPFVGATELISDDVSRNLMHYFDTSEQIPTAVSIGVKLAPDGKCEAAGGVVMQLLPDATEENTQAAENAMQPFVNAAEVIKNFGADGVIREYFPDVEKGGLYLYFPEYKCNCSREKLRAVAASLGKAELIKIAEEEGSVKIHCHYCNTDYVFTRDDVEKMF